ncbi:MAG: hypothetical protein M1817_004942 [Caeruleum heppii]|nr:MAG: hypothetical protein M1817_004942 [Caeruleum heppii]
MRPAPQRVPYHRPSRAGPLQKIHDWVLDHRTTSAGLLVTVGVVLIILYKRHSNSGGKRRARRASNGARKEVVVIVGNRHEQITRSLEQDLERRGFIVYTVVRTQEDKVAVEGEGRPDIKALHLAVTDLAGLTPAIQHFKDHLLKPQQAFPGAAYHSLRLLGVVFVPDPSYATGPIETIAPEVWSDALNTRVLGTIVLSQAFIRIVCELTAKMLILTPSVIPAITPPFHSVESSIVAALEAYTGCLRGELGTLGVDVCQIKLGALDFGVRPTTCQRQGGDSSRADVIAWPSEARMAYGKDYHSQSAMPATRTASRGRFGLARATPVRELHNCVFDTLTARHSPRVQHVGNGSLLYDIVGAWVPIGLVGYLLGHQKRLEMGY